MNHSSLNKSVQFVAALAAVVLMAGRTLAEDEADSKSTAATEAAPDSKSTAAAEAASQEAASPEQIGKLVKQLGDKDYFVRQKAQEQLAKLGFEAFDALNAATTDEDLEIASRAKYLLRLMRVEWTAEGDSPEVKRCLRDYEFDDGRSREAKMRALASLPGGQGLAALCRLVRFEKSVVLSKTAAAALLLNQADKDPPDAATIDTVRKALADCKRPGAAWLLAWTRLGNEPDAVMADFAKWIVEEQGLIRPAQPQVNESSATAETTPEIVGELTRFQIARLKKLGKNDDAQAAITRLVELETGNTESLAELLMWLTDQKAWQAIEDLAQRFAPQFASEPGLLYLLANAYSEQGKSDEAEQTAKRAFKLHPGKQAKDLIYHWAVAMHLRSRGQFAWAQREFEHIIAQAGDAESTELKARSQWWLAEMLHDQGQDGEAAEILQKLVEAIDAGKVNESSLDGHTANEVRARMYYLQACHWEAAEDLAKRRESLDKALKSNPEDVDVLIACYRLPEQTAEQHAEVLELIRKSAAESRELIAQTPDSPLFYNQLAWLIGNTEGDLDEALKCSEKSVELRPEDGGLYDTLARVYYARGDLDNAVKNQSRALELERHSGLIKKQLEFFRKKQEEKEK